MIIDTHTHIFPDSIRFKREAFFDREPEFALLYGSPKARMAGMDDLIHTMDTFGIDLAVTCGFPWRDPALSRLNNDYVLECVSRYPDRVKGLACFDVMSSGAVKEAERCIDAGLCGIGELAFYLAGIDEQALACLKPVMELLRSRGGLPCMIHTNEPIGHMYPGKTPVTLGQIYRLVKTFPDNRIILAHWGGGLLFYHLMKKEIKQALVNTWFDTAASPFLYDPGIYSFAVSAGMADKIVLGTDFPLLTIDRYQADLAQSGISSDAADKICGRNAYRAYFPV